MRIGGDSFIFRDYRIGQGILTLTYESPALVVDFIIVEDSVRVRIGGMKKPKMYKYLLQFYMLGILKSSPPESFFLIYKNREWCIDFGRGEIPLRLACIRADKEFEEDFFNDPIVGDLRNSVKLS